MEAMRTMISSGFGIASTPPPLTAPLGRIRHALPRGALLCTPPVDAGADWAYELENLGARLDLAKLERSVSRAVPGTRLRVQEDPRSRQYSPILLVPKIPRVWPGRVDYALVLVMLASTLAFVLVQFREHLFDFRTLEELGEVPGTE